MVTKNKYEDEYNDKVSLIKAELEDLQDTYQEYASDTEYYIPRRAKRGAGKYEIDEHVQHAQNKVEQFRQQQNELIEEYTELTGQSPDVNSLPDLDLREAASRAYGYARRNQRREQEERQRQQMRLHKTQNVLNSIKGSDMPEEFKKILLEECGCEMNRLGNKNGY